MLSTNISLIVGFMYCLLFQHSSTLVWKSYRSSIRDVFSAKRLFAFRATSNISIPFEKLEVNFARSSGPGGQNVNKVNTKAEIRFHVETADWIPAPIRNRVLIMNSGKMNKDGELVISSQEHRTQAKNRDECLSKLQVILDDASVEPKDRHMWEGIGEKGKQLRRSEKRHRGDVKQARRSSSYDD